MAKKLLPDKLWTRLEPILPRSTKNPKGGRPRVDDRKALTGILFILKTGTPWEYLPEELGCGSGMTCWRRLRDWQKAGVWKKLHRLILEELQAAGKIDWERASLDSSVIQAKRGARKLAQIP